MSIAWCGSLQGGRKFRVLPFVVTAPFMVVVLRALEKTMPHARRPDPQNPMEAQGVDGGMSTTQEQGAGSGTRRGADIWGAALGGLAGARRNDPS